MISIAELYTPTEIQQSLADACKTARLRKNHSRKKASQMSGVPEATIRKFEATSEISLRQFIMLCNVYGELNNCSELFPPPNPVSLQDIIAKQPKRQRGRK